jgi:hypothetical protein
MTNIGNLTSTTKSLFFDTQASKLNHSYLAKECLTEWRENLIKLRTQFQDENSHLST